MPVNIKLLKKVRKLIAEEPRRLDMYLWGVKYARNRIRGEETLPPCGTVACLAGWTIFAARPSVRAKVTPNASLLSILAAKDKNPAREAAGAFIMLVYGGIFLFCGIITVLSLVESQPPKLRFAAMAMGINWVAQGVFAWVLAANHGKVMVRGVDLNEFLPQFMAIVCLAWLAVAWNTAQPEAARQHSVDELALSELQHMEAR